MHAGAEEDQQEDGNDGFFAGHDDYTSCVKDTISFMQPGCIFCSGFLLLC
jgi:hypothetical protein